ncbi:TPA: hypothetical protein DEQ95_04350 [Candidatus Beckwithbacteria bacterium]|nr:MAG: hypothetical protein UY43_C0001G0114 [Candidatus Beckwithbacteria bacterium GW2011_GWC1_49_16]OGD48516.1 MAG: hypothetical protein A2877_02085 [Candidatus Beckwithbacteria bacterium RIFCSPHIGHO2_01_FULL_49_39]OGD50621.1 MAG: hypothetical protein A3D86_00750 [Candidatus Beckwithbacteria bacterium RIFCSPHIGHO2_02_FULL_49_13]OGD51437.1 MAG: hypothetical protein A3K56_04330 [Candidatus Beckwithbacteria bacterium RIFCSPHIGHO2_12_FULL_49_13]OGD58531.1 MAG: hypothetical protein A3J22_05165 [Ca
MEKVVARDSGVEVIFKHPETPQCPNGMTSSRNYKVTKVVEGVNQRQAEAMFETDAAFRLGAVPRCGACGILYKVAGSELPLAG